MHARPLRQPPTSHRHFKTTPKKITTDISFTSPPYPPSRPHPHPAVVGAGVVVVVVAVVAGRAGRVTFRCPQTPYRRLLKLQVLAPVP
ncbi:hypothetical protein E2C01_094820 [Portunus trituberculatus]|uniref:Uncharacterized protein n=1 Tax=Portunus trituberculatus TaxID=210409 RepID=A0A5B7K1W5_PORTR|nr:hypothetical protein [Portunus trituberculatus]